MKKNVFTFSLIFFLYGNFMAYVISQTLIDEDNLHTHLFANYNKELRPWTNFDDFTNVTVKFYITTIKNFDEKNGQLSVAGSVHLAWTDTRLTWDPDPSQNGPYKNIWSTHVSKAKLWKPPFIIVNAYDDFSSLGTNTKVEDYMWLQHTGEVSWSTGAYFEVICSANIVYFPFDTQNCTLMFLAWYYSSAELRFLPAESQFDTRYYEQNGLWELKETSIYLAYFADGTENIRFSFTMKRRPDFYIMNALVPMCITGTLNIFVFLLPNDSGERIGLCVTLLLAITVFMTIVADALPNTATPSLSINNYFMLFDINVNVVILLCVILIARFYHKGEDTSVSPIYKSMYNTLRKLNNLYPKRKVTCDDHSDGKQTSSEEKPQEQKKNVIEDNIENGASLQPKNKINNENISWKDIGEMFDKICLAFFIFVYVIRFIAYLIIFVPKM